MSLRWYVVHAYSNFEHRVADALKERIRLQGLRFAIREGGKTVGSGVVAKVLK